MAAQPLETTLAAPLSNVGTSGVHRAQYSYEQQPLDPHDNSVLHSPFESMRTCPTCGTQYEAPAQFCTRDGVSLRVDAPAQDPYVGTKILNQIRIMRILGAGGMGTVYEGLDEAIGRKVAVKILHKDLLTNRDVATRFQREAKIAHELDHPNLVRLVLFGTLPDGVLYLIIEFLDGPTLAQVLEREGALPVDRAVKIVSQIADAIGYVHRRDIVHRDLKPENVMLVRRDDDSEFPKVLDFGIAKVLVNNDTLMTSTGLIFGTARYISPEGAQGEPVDRRSDVYSLGVIMYQALTGKTPFDAQEPMQLLLKHINDRVPPMKDRLPPGRTVPEALEAVVLRALAKSPAARFADGSAFAKALREAIVVPAVDPRPSFSGVSPTPLALPMVDAPSGIIYGAPAAKASVPTLIGASPLSMSGVSVDPSLSLGSASTVSVDHPEYVANGHSQESIPRTPAKKSAPRVEMPAAPLPKMANGAHGTNGANGHGNNGSQSAHSRAVTVPKTAAIPVSTSLPYGISGAVTVPTEHDDEFAIAGLPSKKPHVPGATRKTIAVVLGTMILTLTVGLGAAWGLEMFPSQRRVKVLARLESSAQEAFEAHRLIGSRGGNDVFAITGSLLQMQPNHPRAIQLRAASAMQLRNRAVELRNNAHPEQGLPLLRDALLLQPDNQEITALVPVFETEIREAQTPRITSDAAVPTQPIARPNTPPRVNRPITVPPNNNGTGTNTGNGTETPPPNNNTGTGVSFTPGRDPTIDPRNPNNGHSTNSNTNPNNTTVTPPDHGNGTTTTPPNNGNNSTTTPPDNTNNGGGGTEF